MANTVFCEKPRKTNILVYFGILTDCNYFKSIKIENRSFQLSFHYLVLTCIECY